MLGSLALERVELSVALVNDAVIQELNKHYRHMDKTTDVLAFPMSDGAANPLAATSTLVLLGDVVLSVDTARRQAARHRRPLLAELTMLLAHGLLHLVGYDHRTDAEDVAMTRRTRELENAATQRTPPRVQHCR